MPNYTHSILTHRQLVLAVYVYLTSVATQIQYKVERYIE